MNGYFKLASFVLLCVALCNCKPATADYDMVVPLPEFIAPEKSSEGFLLDKNVSIAAERGLESCAQFLAEYIAEATGLALPAISMPDEVTDLNSKIILAFAEGYPAEGYSIEVENTWVRIEASEAAGVFYGIQTLRKSLPGKKGAVLLPAVQIIDSPRLPWRGMHLDVARHFFDVSEVERCIDLLALHNLNRFHFHLTDDQGWRIEIKKYPRLTEIGSLGKDSAGNSSDGFFTQEQLQHIVAYAAERFITVVPEVDMPGHMVAALAAYPELGCTGGPYEITGQPGVMDDILCAGSDEVMPFLKDIFGELVEIFPSEYIHIGGDEAPRRRWKECPECQARIRSLNLKSDEHSSAEAKLQSYMVAELGEFLASHGRKIIGWDEILEGGAPQDAAIQAWRGVSIGIKAVRAGHNVVFSPTSSLYFDYYQTRDRSGEPNAIGGLNTLQGVYETEIYTPDLTAPERARIIGLQANLWTEYIATPEHADYMMLPRMGALSEVAWSYPATRDFVAFLPRIAHLSEMYKLLGYNPCPHLFEVNIAAVSDFETQEIGVELTSVEGAEIYYTLDGTTPARRSQLYTEPLHLDSDAALRAVAFVSGFESKPLSADFSINKATMRPIVALTAPDRRYNVTTLVDGLEGPSDFNFGGWTGYHRNPLDVAIDLGEGGTRVSGVKLRTLIDYPAHIGEAALITVKISDDGENYRTVAELAPSEVPLAVTKTINRHELSFPAETARWIEVRVECRDDMPQGHVYYGQARPFVFVDEIQVF